MSETDRAHSSNSLVASSNWVPCGHLHNVAIVTPCWLSVANRDPASEAHTVTAEVNSTLINHRQRKPRSFNHLLSLSTELKSSVLFGKGSRWEDACVCIACTFVGVYEYRCAGFLALKHRSDFCLPLETGSLSVHYCVRQASWPESFWGTFCLRLPP